MPENIPSNRMELFKRKRALAQAQKGLKMLKDKLEALLVEFLSVARDYSAKKESLWKELLVAQARYALSASFSPELADFGQNVYGTLKIEKTEHRVMTLLLPKLDIEEYEPDTAIPPHAATTQGIQAIASYQKLLPKLIGVAQLQASLRALAMEVQSTRRRVNALEYVMVPRLADDVKSIQSKLDEYERGSKSRLLRIKNIIKKKSAF